MSSNKTDAGQFMYNRKYSKPSGNFQTGQNTIIPDMNIGSFSGGSSPSSGSSIPNEPVVGFLYSVSRNGFGEFWPLYIGKNQIGRDSSNSICLKEKTVSSKHAVLNIRRRQGQTHELIAQIQDVGSRNGIFINGEDPGFDAASCSNGDVIKIGNNYTLLLILINPDQIGLSVADNFMPSDDEFENIDDSEYEIRNNRSGSFSSGATEPIDGVYDDMPGVTK